MPDRTERYCVTTGWIRQWVEMRCRPDPVSFDEIGRLYGVSPSLVHRYTKGKVPAKQRAKHPRPFDHQEARRLEVEEGLSRTEIARRLGVSGPRITRVLGPKRECELWRMAS